MRLFAVALTALMLVAAVAAGRMEAAADTPALPGDAGATETGASGAIAGCIDAAKRRDADAAIKLCSLALDTGHLAEAQTIAALVNRGLAHIARNEPAAAIPDFDQAIQLQPDSAAFYDMRALAHAMQGEGDPAINDYAEVIRRGAPADASPAERLLRNGIATHLGGDDAQAAQLFAAALRAAPEGSQDETRALLWRDLALEASRQNALTPLSAAMAGRDLAQWPGPLLQYFQGRITEAALEGMLDDPDPAVASARACDTAFYVAAQALIDGRFNLAKDGFTHAQTLCLESALELTAARAEAIAAARPVAEDIGNDMAQCQAAEANGDGPATIDLCGRALAHADAPDVWRVGAMTRRATAYHRAGDLDRAIADLDAALALRPDSVDLYRQRSQVRFDKGERFGGMADLSYVLTLQPDFVPAYVDRAWIRVSAGDTAGALADFSKAIQVQPDLPRLHLGRGVVSYLAGDDVQAAADFATVIQANAQAPYAVLWLALTEKRKKVEDGGALDAGLAALDLTPWPGPVIRYIRGEISAQDLSGAAAGDPKQECEASFYSGAVARIAGDKAAAKTAFEHAQSVCSPENLEYHAAEAAAAKMR
jgi:lipoprotein NlpI